MPESNALLAKVRVHRWLAPASAGIGAALLVALLRWQAQPSHDALRSPSTAPSQPQSAPEDPRATTAQPPDLEAVIMRRLREATGREPATALGLALQGNAQFPNSADAPERGWIICRSLVELKRFPEAVAEARVVVDQYPNTPWALDVERHLLINPMSDPSERGYGHLSELE